eukprot:793402-Alexandrium_andersonii.AAC.1
MRRRKATGRPVENTERVRVVVCACVGVCVVCVCDCVWKQSSACRRQTGRQGRQDLTGGTPRAPSAWRGASRCPGPQPTRATARRTSSGPRPSRR